MSVTKSCQATCYHAGHSKLCDGGAGVPSYKEQSAQSEGNYQPQPVGDILHNYKSQT